MSKSPTRLASFEIPRDQTTKQDEQPAAEFAPTLAAQSAPAQASVSIAQPPGAVIPLPAPPPVEEPRRQIGARVRLSIAERLRTYMYVTREAQQDAVESALDAYLTSKGF
jgi:hypothetical protein